MLVINTPVYHTLPVCARIVVQNVAYSCGGNICVVLASGLGKTSVGKEILITCEWSFSASLTAYYHFLGVCICLDQVHLDMNIIHVMDQVA